MHQAATPRTKQRLTRIVIEELVIDRKDESEEAVVTIHWTGGRHTEVRVSRIRTGRYPEDRHPSPVEVIRSLGGQWPDRELAVTMNRMRCKSTDGTSWTTMRVRQLRERIGIAAFDPTAPRDKTISVDETRVVSKSAWVLSSVLFERVSCRQSSSCLQHRGRFLRRRLAVTP